MLSWFLHVKIEFSLATSLNSSAMYTLVVFKKSVC